MRRVKKMIFKKAEVEEAKLKIGIYGEPGSGKTFTSLKLATGLGKKIAAIDTEYNMNIYANDFDFYVIETSSLKEVIEVLESKEIDDFDVLIIDSITHLWEDAQNSYLEALKKSKDPRKRQRGEEGDIQFQDWAAIKKPYKKLLNLILEQDKHIIFTGRLKNEYDYNKQSKQLIKSGERMDTERGTEYEPSILLKMVNNGSNKAIVLKDRTNTIQGKTFDKPDITMLKEALKKLGKTHKVKVHDQDAYSEDLFDDNNVNTNTIKEKINKKKEKDNGKLFKDLPKNKQIEIATSIDPLIKQIAEETDGTIQETKEQLLNEWYGVTSRNDLTVNQCREFYMKLKERLREVQQV
jgi:hypothetical protein